MTYDQNMDDEKPPKRLLPEGWRIFKILNGREQVSKSDNEMIVFSLEDELNESIDEVYCVLQKGKRWTLKSILTAAGIERNSDGNFKWDISDLVGKRILGLVAHEPNEFINRKGETIKGTQHRLVDFKKCTTPPIGKEKPVVWDE